MKRWAMLLPLLFLASCEIVDKNMYNQVSFKTQKEPVKRNPKGSLPVNGIKTDYGERDPATLEPPFPLDERAAANGKPLYAMYCVPCHGENGRFETKVALKMDVQPFDLTGESAKEMTNGQLFAKILSSESVMPKYRSELTDAEAWEVAAFVRKLQKGK